MTLEELQIEYTKLQDEFTKLKAEKETLLEDIETQKSTYEGKITTLENDKEILRTTNMDLFLKVKDSHKSNITEEKETEEKTSFDDVLNSL